MTNSEYKEALAAIGKGKVVEFDGRTAATPEELDFIRAAGKGSEEARPTSEEVADLERQVKDLEAQVDALKAENDRLKESALDSDDAKAAVKALEEIPGVGPKTAQGLYLAGHRDIEAVFALGDDDLTAAANFDAKRLAAAREWFAARGRRNNRR